MVYESLGRLSGRCVPTTDIPLVQKRCCEYRGSPEYAGLSQVAGLCVARAMYKVQQGVYRMRIIFLAGLLVALIGSGLAAAAPTELKMVTVADGVQLSATRWGNADGLLIQGYYMLFT